MYNFNQVAFSYLASFSLVIATSLVLWMGVREDTRKYHWRPVVFGCGLLLLAITNMVMHISGMGGVTGYSLALYGISFALIYLAMIKIKWHYIFLLFIIVPFMLPRENYLFLLALAGIIPLIFISGRKYCHDLTICRNSSRTEELREAREWSLFFILLLLSVIPYYLGYLFGGSAEVYLGVIGAVLQALAAVALYYHVLHSYQANRTEKFIFPLMLAFVTIFLSMGFLINFVVQNELKETYLNFLEEEAKGVKMYSEDASSGTSLAERIKEKDPTLNDLADEVTASTGIRYTYLLNDTRVAASISAGGAGRLIGTQLDNPEVANTVLAEGGIYRGAIVKGEKVTYAVYVPVYDEKNEIIGMIGTGRFLERNMYFQNKILLVVASGAALVMLISLLVIAADLPKKLKSRN